jgi:HSP20 family protein
VISALLLEVLKVSENEKKEKVEIKDPEERVIAPWRPSDIFQAFDEMWTDFRRDLLRPWRPLEYRWKPLRRGEMPTDIMPREACVDLIDAGNEYQVCAEVPGIPKDMLDVTITKDVIEISGKAEVERREEDIGYVVRERGYSKIYKRIAFPEEAIPDEAKATLKDGLLEIRVPKKMPTSEDKKHKVEIK